MQPSEDPAEIVIPKDSKTVVRRPMKSTISTSYGRRAVFNPQKIDRKANDFDIMAPGTRASDSSLHKENPGLLAFRNQTAKTKTRPKVSRPRTGAEPIQNYSLLGQRPVSPTKNTKGNAVLLVQRNIERERESIAFDEDPVAYFAKRKDGSGHRFIYLNYAGDRSDPNFSPYALQKVPYAEINPEYFTMSLHGVTRIQPNGYTEQTTLDGWAKESAAYESIRKLKTFSQYCFWKPFHIWKRFVMRQRYEEISNWAVNIPYFRFPSFFQYALKIFKETSDAMIKKYLLSLVPHKKFLLESYKMAIVQNRENLTSEYSEFLGRVADSIIALHSAIREPARLVVRDEDFQEIKRRNPNLGQLKVLEQKIDAEKKRRMEMVESEINSLSQWIRMIDYNLLESMARSCYEAWQIAVDEASQDQASIFLIELSFDNEGHIVFSPSLDELLETVNVSLDESFEMLSELPSLISDRRIYEHLKINPKIIAEQGPKFKQMIEPNTEYENLKKEIGQIITKSYLDAETYCQSYTDFFSIFQMNESWNPQQYAKARGGNGKEYNLSTFMGLYDDETEVIYNPSKETILDMPKVRSDISRFQLDETRLGQFRSCTIRGVLYIDSRKLRSLLIPIPINSLKALKEFLLGMQDKKTEMVKKIFSFCGKKLHKEPMSLEQFVDYCQFVNMVEEMTPYIAQEIAFVDELCAMLEEANLVKIDSLGSARNSLHNGFRNFKENQQIAKNVREGISDKFIMVLQQRLRTKEQKLNKYNVRIMSYPMSIQNCHVETSLPQMRKIREKLAKLKPEIQALDHCQNVMGVKIHDFALFEEVQRGAQFTEKLYQAVSDYILMVDQITTVAFASVKITEFVDEVKKIQAAVDELQSTAKASNALLADLVMKMNEIYPYIEQLLQLSRAGMCTRHWNKLFDECDQAGMYTPQITIQDLRRLRILDEKEKIAVITSTSEGESKMEIDFKNIKDRWQEVQLPLLEEQAQTEDSLLLGDIEPLFQEISDAQITLQGMLGIPFVQSIKKEIEELASVLEYYAQVMDAWRTFQSNWTILASFFAREETKAIMESQSAKFDIVKRFWMSLVSHTMENPALCHVCEYTALLETLIEKNRTLESILVSSGKFIDSRRKILPRLYFLSNEEVLTLFSTIDFNIFNKHLVKMFMHVHNFDYHVHESGAGQKISNIQDFSRLRIFAIVGDSSDSFMLSKMVSCSGQIEDWVAKLEDSMKLSVKEQVAESLLRYTSSSINDWILTVPVYIASLTLSILFTRDIDECFNNYDSNPRVFINYENQIIQKIQELTNSLSAPLSGNDLMKVASVIIAFNSQMNTLKSLGERIPSFSQAINWQNKPKMRFNNQTKAITIEFGESTVEHGYEFWGSTVQFVHTPASERVMLNLCSSIERGNLPYLFGGALVGKKHLIADLAAYYGRYCYFMPVFSDDHHMFIERVLSGTIANGGWLIFHGLDKLPQQNLCFLYESVVEIMKQKNSGSKTCTISGNTVPILPGSFVFFTGGKDMFKSETFPHQLRSILKPVGFAAPDMRMIADVKLSALGFKTTKHIAHKISMFLNTVPSVLRGVRLTSGLFALDTILSSGNELLREIMYTSTVPFITYYECVRTAEEYVIARAAFNFFVTKVNESEKNVLLQLLYTHFQIFENYEEFSQRITCRDVFTTAQMDNMIYENVLKQAQSICCEAKFGEYFAGKALELWHNMKTYPCIIMSGKVNTGKTMVVDFLKKAIDELRAHDPEVNGLFVDALPIKVYDMFHMIETWKQIYGEVQSSDEGLMWLSGQLQSYVNNLMLSQSNHHVILRFNGPMDPNFAEMLAQMVGSDDSKLFRLNSTDTISLNDNIHFFVETDTLTEMTPVCVSRCAIIHMESVEDGALVVFARAVQSYPDDIPTDTMTILRNLFVSILKEVVPAVYATPNTIYYNSSEEKIFGGDSYIANELAYKALCLALHDMDIGVLEKNDEDELRTILILSFFQVYAPILEKDSVLSFDNWIRATFVVQIPPDWVGFNVPDCFWDAFPRPTLESMRYYKGKLIPVDFILLKEKPLLKRRAWLPNLKLPSDISVCIPRYLPILSEIKVLIRNRSSFMLVGPRSCGKSTLLSYAFQHADNVVPVVIPITKCSTALSVQEFIQSHTSIITKSYVSSSTTNVYALVFDNVPPENKHITEFIRMLTSTGKIPVVSRKDAKFLYQLQIRNFFVVVTAQGWSGFGARFLSQFYPLRLAEPKTDMMKYVIKGIGGHFGVSRPLINMATTFVEAFACAPETRFHFTHILDTLCLLDSRSSTSQSENMSCIKSLLFEMKLMFYHRITDQKIRDRFMEVYCEMFRESEVRLLPRIVFSGSDVIYTKINFSTDMSSCVTSDDTKAFGTLRRELRYYLKKYNETKGNNKIILSLSRPQLEIYTLIYRVLAYPRGNIVLIGDEGFGRTSLVKLVSQVTETQLVSVPAYTGITDTDTKKRQKDLKKLLAGVVYSCAVSNKSVILLMNMRDVCEEDWPILSHLIEFYDFFDLFDDLALAELCHKFAQPRKLNIIHKLYIYEQLKLSLALRLHFVIIADPSFDITSVPRFYLIDTRDHLNTHFSWYVRDMLRNPKYEELVDIMPEEIHALLVNVHKIISSEVPEIGGNQFYSFVDTFIRLAHNEVRTLHKKNKDIEGALDFLSDLDHAIKEVEDRIAEIKPYLEALQSDPAKLKVTFTQKKSVLQEKISKLDEEERLKQAEVRQLTDEMLPLKTEMIDLNVRIDLVRHQLNGLQQSNIDQLLEFSDKPPGPLRKLFEMLCVFMEQPPQYEPYGRRLLNDPNLLANLTEKISHVDVPSSVLTKARPVFTQTQFTKGDYDSVSRTVLVLYEWIDTVYKYAFTSEKLTEKTKEHETKTNEFIAFVDQAKIKKDTLTKQISDLDKELKELLNSIQAREALDREHKAIESRRRTLSALYKGLDIIGENWSDETREFESNRKLIVGNSLIMALHIAYFGTMDMSLRMDVFNKIIDEMKGMGVTGNFTDPNQYISSQLTILTQHEAIETAPKGSIIRDVETDLQLVRILPRASLIVDPDGLVKQRLIMSFPSERIVYTSIMSHNLAAVIKKCMKQGLVLILNDVTWLHPLIREVIPYTIRYKRRETDECTIDGETFVVNMNFHMFMFSTSVDVDPNLKSRVILLDIAKHSLASVEEIITNTFVDFFDPEMMPRVKGVEQAEIQHNLDIIKYEADALEGITNIVRKQHKDHEYDYMADEEALGALLQAKECYFATMKVTSDSKNIMNELRMTVEQFSSHIELCKIFWEALSRYMPRIRPYHVFSFQTYMKIINNAIQSCGFHQGILAPNQHPVLHDTIVNHIMKFILPKLPFKDALFFLFASGFIRARIHGKCKEDDFNSILEHFDTEYNGKCDYTIIDVHGGETIDQLKYCNVVNIFNFITQFVIEQFGHDILNRLPILHLDSCISTSSKIPVLVQLRHQKDITPILEDYISLRGKGRNMVTISICENEQMLARAKETLAKCVTQDKWVLMHCERMSRSVCAFVYDMLKTITDPAENFRLIFLCGCTEQLPQELLMKFERFEYENFPAPRHQLLEILQHHSSSMISSSKVSRRLSYAFSLLFSIIKFRGFLTGLGFTEDVYVSEMTLKNVILRMKESVDIRVLGDVPIRNIRDQLLDIEFGASVTNSYDAKKMRAHVYMLATPDVVDDGFGFIDQQSGDMSVYALPSESTPVNNWVHNVERIPPFPYCDVLCMNKLVASQIRNWNMSRWIMTPFIRIYKPVIDEVKEIHQKITNMLSQMPEHLALRDSDKKSPLMMFLSNEIATYNSTVTKMKIDLSEALAGRNSAVFECIGRSVVPPEWNEVLCYSGTKHLAKFIKNVKARQMLYSSWIMNGMIPHKIDVNWIRDIRGLLSCYLNEIAVQRSSTVDVMSYEFTIGEENNEGAGITLTGIHLIGGNWDHNEKKLIQPNARTPSVQRFPDCFCAPVKTKTKLPHTFMCPLFKSMPAQQFLVGYDKQCRNGELNNLQWNIPLRTEVVEKQLITTGVSLVCHLPDNF